MNATLQICIHTPREELYVSGGCTVQPPDSYNSHPFSVNGWNYIMSPPHTSPPRGFCFVLYLTHTWKSKVRDDKTITGNGIYFRNAWWCLSPVVTKSHCGRKAAGRIWQTDTQRNKRTVSTGVCWPRPWQVWQSTGDAVIVLPGAAELFSHLLPWDQSRRTNWTKTSV